MGQYIVRRVLMAFPVLILVSIVVFAGVRVVPGDICSIVLGVDTSGQGGVAAAENCDRVKHDLGLDKPLTTQYFHWMGNILTGDFGDSMTNRTPVLHLIERRMYTTLELATLATVFSIAIALPVGVYSALKQDQFADVVLRFLTIGWLSLPQFWVGTMLIVFPAIWWGYATPVPYVQFGDDP